jgi:hypothetical protein
VPSTLVDEEMANATIGIQTANQVHTADQSSEPTHAVTGQNPDGRAAEPILGGTIPPRATGGRDLSAEGGIGAVNTDHNGADGRVTFGSPAIRSSDQEEAELRARIAMDSLQLNALTHAEARQRGSSVDRSGPSTSTSILRGRNPIEIPPRRQTPAIHTPLKRNSMCRASTIWPKSTKKYRGPETREKSTKHLEKFTEYKFDVRNTITHFQHFETLRLGHLCALSHLEGEAKLLVMKWKNLQPVGTLCSKDKIFFLLAEQCKLVELDGMYIAAEVQATTAYTVSLAIHREVGPNSK